MSKFSTIFVITATTLIITASSGSAQTTTAKTYAERVHSVAALKEHIANREARFEVLRQDLLALDARTEKQIDQIVTTLASMRDSESSKTRIANV